MAIWQMAKRVSTKTESHMYADGKRRRLTVLVQLLLIHYFEVVLLPAVDQCYDGSSSIATQALTRMAA